MNLASSTIILWSDGWISLPARHLYLLIFPDDNGNIFAASLLILYCSFPSLILSPTVLISFYILSKTFFLKREILSDGRVVSITKNDFGLWIYSTFVIKIHKALEINIWWTIKCDMLKLLFIWDFHNEIMCWI